MTEYRDVHSQAGLEAALAADDVIPVCVGDGHYHIPAAYGSATVEASGSATVEAYGSATVRAYGSATVRAYDSATVEAYGSATVRAYGSATVQATKYVAIHRFAPTATITGGVVISIPDWATATTEEWADYTGRTITSRTITVYKAVDRQLVSDHGTAYPVGETVTAPDWEAARICGSGLHFSQTPRHANRYRQNATHSRFLACQISTDDAVVLDHDKIKARSCVVLHEVDIDGQPLTDAAGGAA
jgi:hypothetical protein